jgi:hypothetical protein
VAGFEQVGVDFLADMKAQGVKVIKCEEVEI